MLQGRSGVEVECGFGAEVEEEVDDAEVGDEALAVGAYLIVRAGREGDVGESSCSGGSWSIDDFGAYVEQPAEQGVESGVVFDDCLPDPSVGVKPAEVVGVEFKERRASVCRCEGGEVDVPPVVVWRDAYVGKARCCEALRPDDWHGEADDAVGVGYDGAVCRFVAFVEACVGVNPDASRRRHGGEAADGA